MNEAPPPSRSSIEGEILVAPRRDLHVGEASAFARHRARILDGESASRWLQDVVLALWDGGSDPVALSPLEIVGEGAFVIFVELIQQYRLLGENDAAFEGLAQEIVRRRIEEELRVRGSEYDLAPAAIRLVRRGTDGEGLPPLP